MKYFVLLVLAMGGLSGCDLEWDIAVSRCDGAQIRDAMRRQCSSADLIVCMACSDEVCTRAQCVPAERHREYLESNDGGQRDAWPNGLGDGGVSDSGPGDQ